MNAALYAGVVDNNGKLVQDVSKEDIILEGHIVHANGTTLVPDYRASAPGGMPFPWAEKLPNFMKSFGLKTKEDFMKRASVEAYENARGSR